LAQIEGVSLVLGNNEKQYLLQLRRRPAAPDYHPAVKKTPSR